MDVEIMVEALPLLGVCNLCLNQDAVKSMIVSHKHNGIQELYSDMLLKCFSIDVSNIDLGDIKCLICDPCVHKLRDAVKFKEQAEASLKVLKRNAKTNVSEESKSAVKDIKSEDSMNEDSLENTFDDFCDEEDNITLNEFKIKDEPIKEEKPIRKTKKVMSTKRLFALKKKDFTET